MTNSGENRLAEQWALICEWIKQKQDETWVICFVEEFLQSMEGRWNYRMFKRACTSKMFNSFSPKKPSPFGLALVGVSPAPCVHEAPWGYPCHTGTPPCGNSFSVFLIRLHLFEGRDCLLPTHAQYRVLAFSKWLSNVEKLNEGRGYRLNCYKMWANGAKAGRF